MVEYIQNYIFSKQGITIKKIVKNKQIATTKNKRKKKQ